MAATRKINVRFLGILLGSLVVLGTSVYFVNAFQVRRHADVLKRRAAQAFQEERYDVAAKYYYQYLIQHPDDVEARISRGQALDKKAPNDLGARKEAFNNFEYVLWRDPEQEEIRRRQ